MASDAATITRCHDLQPAINRFVELMNELPSSVSGESRRQSKQSQPQIPHTRSPASRPEPTRDVSSENWTTTMAIAPGMDNLCATVPANPENEFIGDFPLENSPFFPDLLDQLGWDWAIFSQLFPESETNCENLTF